MGIRLPSCHFLVFHRLGRFLDLSTHSCSMLQRYVSGTGVMNEQRASSIVCSSDTYFGYGKLVGSVHWKNEAIGKNYWLPITEIVCL